MEVGAGLSFSIKTRGVPHPADCSNALPPPCPSRYSLQHAVGNLVPRLASCDSTDSILKELPKHHLLSPQPAGCVTLLHGV